MPTKRTRRTRARRTAAMSWQVEFMATGARLDGCNVFLANDLAELRRLWSEHRDEIEAAARAAGRARPFVDLTEPPPRPSRTKRGKRKHP